MIDPFIAIQTSGGFLALWAFWYLFWKDYVVDKFRQDVFSLRNDLFLATAKGEAPFSFESHEFKKTMDVLNVSIRSVENLTVLRFVLMSLFKAILAPGRPFETIDQENQAITPSTSEDAKTYLKAIQCRHGMYTMRYLSTISPTFILLMTVLIFRALLVAIPRALNRSLSKVVCVLEQRFNNVLKDYCYVIGELTEIGAGHEMDGEAA